MLKEESCRVLQKHPVPVHTGTSLERNLCVKMRITVVQPENNDVLLLLLFVFGHIP
jgi:hypothetical protein